MSKFMPSRLVLAFLLMVFAALAQRAQAFEAPVFDADAKVAIQKMRTYCGACHAVGDLRFIRSDDDAEVWAYLFANRAPNSRKIWAQNIVEVLSWPRDVPPPFDQPMDPGNNRDWMPKGAKRLTFAEDQVGGEATRQLILRKLRAQPEDGESDE
jgi:hypothetical protein